MQKQNRPTRMNLHLSTSSPARQRDPSWPCCHTVLNQRWVNIQSLVGLSASPQQTNWLQRSLCWSYQAHSYLKDLALSCWNPPPGHRKLQGDFMYITVVTAEGRRCDITSCPKGFFLNRWTYVWHFAERLNPINNWQLIWHKMIFFTIHRSTEDAFDPCPAQSSPVCHCFTDLLCHISPAFKQTFTTLKNW